MVIEWRPIAKLWQREKAPRRNSRKDIEKVVNITRRFGVRVPLVTKRDGQVLSHFIAVIAAKQLGYDELPVVIADDLNDVECEQLSLALTRFYELGKFDQQLLGEVLIDLRAAVPDICFEDLGFEAAEVDAAIGSLAEAEPDETDQPIQANAVSSLGDMWLCGPHKVGCFDAANASQLARLLPKPAAMASADSPYNCRVGGFVTSRAHREFVQGSGEMSAEELAAAFDNWCRAMAANLKPGALVYLYSDWRSANTFMTLANEVFGPMLNMAVWVKERAGQGSFYRSQHELVLIYAMPGAPPRNNVQLGRHGRNRTNVWRYPSAASFGRTGTEGDLLVDHPTPKNKEMIADTMLDATKRGETVLDPFPGVGLDADRGGEDRQDMLRV